MEPIEAVLFDFHSTLVDNGNPRDWLIRALRKRAEDAGHAPTGLDDKALIRAFEEESLRTPEHHSVKQTRNHTDADDFCADLHRVWEHAKHIDPKSTRDLSAPLHRSVFMEVMKTHFETSLALNEALYDTLTGGWITYDDAIEMLDDLKARNIKMGLISNVGFDIRPVLKREKLDIYFDSVVLSCEMDDVKPSRDLFERCLRDLGVEAARALMVGDDVHADGGAALLGIRTLILPKTIGKVHGLALVTKLVD